MKKTIESIITFGAGLSVYKVVRDFYKRGDHHGAFVTLGNILVSAECGIVALGLTRTVIKTAEDWISVHSIKNEEKTEEEGETTDE